MAETRKPEPTVGDDNFPNSAHRNRNDTIPNTIPNTRPNTGIMQELINRDYRSKIGVVMSDYRGHGKWRKYRGGDMHTISHPPGDQLSVDCQNLILDAKFENILSNSKHSQELLALIEEYDVRVFVGEGYFDMGTLSDLEDSIGPVGPIGSIDSIDGSGDSSDGPS